RAGEGPCLLVANTFRMGGHATHDEREARATFLADWFAEWGKRDPVGLYEEHLKGRLKNGLKRLEEAERVVEAESLKAEEGALASRERAVPAPESAVGGVYAP